MTDTPTPMHTAGGSPNLTPEERAQELVEICRRSRAGVKQESLNYQFDNSYAQCVTAIASALRAVLSRSPASSAKEQQGK